jgi:hypothetical protein
LNIAHLQFRFARQVGEQGNLLSPVASPHAAIAVAISDVPASLVGPEGRRHVAKVATAHGSSSGFVDTSESKVPDVGAAYARANGASSRI